MPTAKTILASVRVTLRQVQECQKEVLHATEQVGVHARRNQEQFRNALRQALSRWIEGSNYALFKERMHIHAPDVFDVLRQYEDELESAERSTRGLSLSEVEAVKRHEKREQDVALSGMRRAIVGVRNNYLHVEEALQQVYKHRLEKPSKPPEDDPRAWIAIVDMAMAMLKEPEQETRIWERLRGNTNQIHAVARKIEQRNKEGCPTMLRHLNESLEIYAKNQELYQASKNRLDDLQTNATLQKSVTRWQELQNMGCVGYLIAHLPSWDSLLQLAQQLDVLEGHRYLEDIFESQVRSSNTDDVARRVQLLFPEWERHLNDIQVLLKKHDNNLTDYPDNPLESMCDAICRLCSNMESWLNDSTNRGGLFLDRMDEIDQLLNQGMQAFFEHPLSQH